MRRKRENEFYHCGRATVGDSSLLTKMFRSLLDNVGECGQSMKWQTLREGVVLDEGDHSEHGKVLGVKDQVKV